MLWTIIKSILAAFSLTLMFLTAVYTSQARISASATPRWIGDTQSEAPFLIDYAATRKELLLGFLRDKFPDLNLPEPEEKPQNPLSLQALKERTALN